MSKKDPSIPAVPKAGQARDNFDGSIKESVEILLGQRGNEPALRDSSQFVASDAFFGTDRILTLQVERGGAGTAATMMAMGNGSTTYGAVFPFDVEVIGATLAATALTGTFTAQLAVNGAALGSGYQMSVTGSGGFAQTSANWRAKPALVRAGQPINLYQTAAGSASTGQVGMLFVRPAK